MFGSAHKSIPGVPYDVQRVYNQLTPKPKELLRGAYQRRFIRDGEVGVYNHKERRTKRRYLFLFNDVLLITKREGSSKYWLKVYISLKTSLRVEDVPDSTTRNKVEFRVYAPKKTFILFTRSESEKLAWIRDIRAAMAGEYNKTGAQESQGSPASTTSANFERRTNISSAFDKKTEKEHITLSGDIGSIEIPGMDSAGKGGDFDGDICFDDDSDEDGTGGFDSISAPGQASPADFSVQPTSQAADPFGSGQGSDLGAFGMAPVDLGAPTAAPTGADPFDQLAGRGSAAPVIAPAPQQQQQQQQQPFGGMQPFAASQPLQPMSAGDMLSPTPADASPLVSSSQPIAPTSSASGGDPFAALKGLSSSPQTGGMSRMGSYGSSGGMGMGNMGAPQQQPLGNYGMANSGGMGMGMGMQQPMGMGMQQPNMGNNMGSMGMGMQQPMGMGMGMQQPMGMGMQQPMGMGMQQPMGMGMQQPMGQFQFSQPQQQQQQQQQQSSQQNQFQF